MKPSRLARALRSLAVSWLALAAALLAASFALGCSGSSSPAPQDGPACVALDACCAEMTGASAASCASAAGTAHQAGSGVSCATVLATFQASELCGVSPLPDGGGLPPVDASAPCTLTGTCPPDSGALRADTGAAPLGTQCQPIMCGDGAGFEACITTTGGGACSASFVFPDGTSFACSSCQDCTSASASAVSYCGGTVVVDSGVADTGILDATIAVDACGTTPALHPETEAGVYCPFTATGDIHCPAGGQCCEAPESAGGTSSTCAALGAACPIPLSLAWECDGPLDCAGSRAGPVCCAAGTVATDPVCGYDRGTGLTGSYCATSCTPGDISICSSPTDPCSSGTCTPFKVAGVVLGTCM